MEIIFIKHNRQNYDEQLELFRNNGTGNYDYVSCKTLLVVLM